MGRRLCRVTEASTADYRLFEWLNLCRGFLFFLLLVDFGLCLPLSCKIWYDEHPSRLIVNRWLLETEWHISSDSAIWFFFFKKTIGFWKVCTIKYHVFEHNAYFFVLSRVHILITSCFVVIAESLYRTVSAAWCGDFVHQLLHPLIHYPSP
jgi:hypothetical protein